MRSPVLTSNVQISDVTSFGDQTSIVATNQSSSTGHTNTGRSVDDGYNSKDAVPGFGVVVESVITVPSPDDPNVLLDTITSSMFSNRLASNLNLVVQERFSDHGGLKTDMIKLVSLPTKHNISQDAAVARAKGDALRVLLLFSLGTVSTAYALVGGWATAKACWRRGRTSNDKSSPVLAIFSFALGKSRDNDDEAYQSMRLKPDLESKSTSLADDSAGPYEDPDKSWYEGGQYQRDEKFDDDECGRGVYI